MARQRPDPWDQPHSHRQWQEPAAAPPGPGTGRRARLIVLGLVGGVVALVIVLAVAGAATSAAAAAAAFPRWA